MAIVRHLGFAHVAKVGKGKVAKSVLQRRDVGKLTINMISPSVIDVQRQSEVIISYCIVYYINLHNI